MSYTCTLRPLARHLLLGLLPAALASCASPRTLGTGTSGGSVHAALVGADGFTAGLSAYNPSFTPDGRTVVFARSEPGFVHPVIHIARRRGAEWSPARPVPFADARWGDSDPTFSADGRTLWFVSDRPAAGRDSARRDLDIWRVRREPAGDGERWGVPERLGVEVNSRGQELGPSWRDSVLYFASARRAGAGGLDLWAARELPDGRFATATLFGGALNTTAHESDPEFSPDGRTLLFWSDRIGGRGSADLWASRRRADGTWAEPTLLRGAANSPWFDFTPASTPDGQWLWFASERPTTTGAVTDPAQHRHGESAAAVWRVPARLVLP